MVEINDDKLNNKFLDIATNGLRTLGHRLLMSALLRFSLIAIGWCLGVWVWEADGGEHGHKDWKIHHFLFPRPE